MSLTPLNLGILYQTTSRPWGGVNSFFRNFIKYAKADKRVRIPNKLSDADVVLTAGHYSGPGKTLKKWQLQNISRGLSLGNSFGRIIGKGDRKLAFRLDGLRRVYAPEVGGADEQLIENLELADSVVFQSHFSKSCFLNENIYFPERNTIILNGTDTNNFRPSNSKDLDPKHVRIVSNSWSINPRKGFTSIAEFSRIDRIEISHIGNWPDNIPTEKVSLLGVMGEESISEILKEADFLLFPSQNEACSNVVVEALASGVPVLYHDSGGTPELCQQGRFGLPIPTDILDLAIIREFLSQALDLHSLMRSQILESRMSFAFKSCYDRYIKHLESL